MGRPTTTRPDPTGAPSRGRRLGGLAVAVVALATTAGITACSGDDDASTATTEAPTEAPSEAPGTDAADTGTPDGPVVTIQMFAFTPDVVEVPVGTTVTWQDMDKIDHTVSSDDGAPAIVELGLSGQGDTASFTFDEPGTYDYHCSIHTFMAGTVVVTG